MRLQDVLVPFIVSNIVSIILIFICYKRPKVGKYVWGVFFTAAGLFNLYTAWTTPQAYVEMYGATAVFSFYKDFIYGIFSVHTTLFISLIASGQIIIAILLFTRKILFKLGTIGGMIFLIAISPLGLGSAFPATILMAFSLFILLKKTDSL